MFATGGTLVMPWRTADGWNRIFRRVIHLGRDGAGTGWGLDSARVAPKVALLFIYRLSEDSLHVSWHLFSGCRTSQFVVNLSFFPHP